MFWNRYVKYIPVLFIGEVFIMLTRQAMRKMEHMLAKTPAMKTNVRMSCLCLAIWSLKSIGIGSATIAKSKTT